MTEEYKIYLQIDSNSRLTIGFLKQNHADAFLESLETKKERPPNSGVRMERGFLTHMVKMQLPKDKLLYGALMLDRCTLEFRKGNEETARSWLKYLDSIARGVEGSELKVDILLNQDKQRLLDTWGLGNRIHQTGQDAKSSNQKESARTTGPRESKRTTRSKVLEKVEKVKDGADKLKGVIGKRSKKNRSGGNLGATSVPN